MSWKVLIVAEHDGAKLNVSTAKCVTCALGVAGAEISVAVCAVDAAAVAAQAARLAGVSGVLAVENPANQHALAAVLAPQLVALSGPFTHVLGPSTTFGKDLMARVAGLLGAAQVSDIMAIVSPTRFRRPIYAGNAILTVEAAGDGKIVGTVRMASFEAAGPAATPAPVEKVAVSAQLPTHTRFVSVYSLAGKLGAAVGASRAAVDAGYAPNEMQVGQTGKIIAPELYVAVGISGAIQHLTGIKDARTIVAINKDAEAPIFEVADFGLVGDLFQIIPEIELLI
ncbi:MAG: electron transfer flavoprotein subunit alpha/FixB family protein [Gammaproteobacteria bacterium]|nr:MAG: electron transfer flavoprotein subunit alpha/FixB family protein [Gammaproteobacteria bacterium]